MLNDFCENLLNCYKLLEKIDNMEVGSDEYKYAINTLLILTYSSFEQFNKNLLIEIKKKIGRNHRFVPIIINNNADEKNFVAPTRSDVLLHYFPLLQGSYFYCEYKQSIDTLIYARNNFAHQGDHTATLDDIKKSILNIQYIVRFLYKFYLEEEDNNEIEFKYYLASETNLIKELDNSIRTMKNIINIQNGTSPPIVKDKITSLNEKIVAYNEKSEHHFSLDLRMCITVNSIEIIDINDSNDLILNKLLAIKEMIISQSIYKEPSSSIQLEDIKACILKIWGERIF
ncbi:TPA: hypothetical protein ACGO4Y_001598 [Streptococcus suis]|jgi:hypothetical protein